MKRSKRYCDQNVVLFGFFVKCEAPKIRPHRPALMMSRRASRERGRGNSLEWRASVLLFPISVLIFPCMQPPRHTTSEAPLLLRLLVSLSVNVHDEVLVADVELGGVCWVVTSEAGALLGGRLGEGQGEGGGALGGLASRRVGFTVTR